MANISITLECNRACSYCFALVSSKTSKMSRTTFLQVLNFLKRSNIDQARLLGGEPTLHPDFSWFVRQALKQGFRILVFSNGLMPEIALQCLEQGPLEKISVLVNINPLEEQNFEETANQTKTLRRLNEKVTVGFNIHTPNPNLEFLLPMISQYQLNPSIRLGLAHHCIGRFNKYIHPKHYSTVGEQVSKFVQNAMEQGITVEYDCGFVPCMFPENFFQLTNTDPKVIGPCCGPVPDILPDGTTVPCYPLASDFRLLPDDESTAGYLQKKFKKQIQPHKTTGIYKECVSCTLIESGGCTGGCVAGTLLRSRSYSFSIELPEPWKGYQRSRKYEISVSPGEKYREIKLNPASSESGTAQWVIPYVDQSLSFWDQLYDDYGKMLKEVYCPLPDDGDIIGSGRPPQTTQYLKDFLQYSSFKHSVVINPMPLPRPVYEIAPRIIEALRRFDGEYGLEGVTVSNLHLATRLRERFTDLSLTASVLMDISKSNQVVMLSEIFNSLVPSTRIMRDLPALKNLREAFNGCIRLIVNEACLPGCPFRVQHFHEMNSGISYPRSLCSELLKKHPWLRLTGAWVLPQHLHLYNEIYDELKLSGRVTLCNPFMYRQVLDAYIHRHPLFPNQIGGGPASMLEPLEINEDFFTHTLQCSQQCFKCIFCREYYKKTRIKNKGGTKNERQKVKRSIDRS